MRPLGVGDAVTVLRAARLPDVEEPIGVSVIERVTRAESGERLYWVRGFPCARTERELRRWTSMAENWAEEDEEQRPGERETVRCLDCGWAVLVGEPCGRCGLGVNE